MLIQEDIEESTIDEKNAFLETSLWLDLLKNGKCYGCTVHKVQLPVTCVQDWSINAFILGILSYFNS